MSGPDVSVTAAAPGVYRVVVGQGQAIQEYRVTVPSSMIDDLGLPGTDEATLVHESFAFLLEREPATSILTSFDLTVIGKYFPEYDREIRRRLE